MEGDFQSETLRTLSSRYADWHGYISLVVCILGVPLNLINITVLTRKHMQTPINCILTWLAVSDMLTMMSYIPFAIHFYCEHNANSISAEKNSRRWMQFLVVYLNFSATTHTISIWLGVALAIFRYRHIQSPAKGNLTRMRRLIRARLVVCAIYIGSIILMIPNYVSYNLLEERPNNTTLFVFEGWKLGTPDVKPVVLLNLVLYSVVAKLVPCILMIVYGGLLLRTLNHKLKVNRRRLSGNSTLYNQRTLDTSRTTVMLLIVLVLFLITELPQAILILLCIFLRNFFDNVYIPLGDTMDIIALINSGIDFVLYCSMSQEFRKTFLRICCSVSRKSSGSSKNTIPFESLHTTLIRLR